MERMRNLKHCNENPNSFLNKIGKALKKPNKLVYNRIEGKQSKVTSCVNDS